MYHRYPMRALIWDYIRTAVGLLIALVPLVLGSPGDVFFVILVTLALLFLGYGLRTLRLQLTAYEILPDGVMSHGPFKRLHVWDSVSAMRLRYYSTVRDKNRRDLEHGWLELKITSPAGTMRIDSEVEGFSAILEAAANAADTHEITMDETTEENFKAFRAEKTPPPGETGSGTAA